MGNFTAEMCLVLLEDIGENVANYGNHLSLQSEVWATAVDEMLHASYIQAVDRCKSFFRHTIEHVQRKCGTMK